VIVLFTINVVEIPTEGGGAKELRWAESKEAAHRRPLRDGKAAGQRLRSARKTVAVGLGHRLGHVVRSIGPQKQPEKLVSIVSPGVSTGM
jgi:hypothetical protein